MDIADRSILAEMALQFVPQREVVATAGLGHLLRRSATAREYLRALASAGGSADSFDAARLIADFFVAHPMVAAGG